MLPSPLKCFYGLIILARVLLAEEWSETSTFACVAPNDKWTFCNPKLSVEDRVRDLISRINDTDKANLLTARGTGGKGKHMQALPALGVPAYYWGTNCLHSLNTHECVTNSTGHKVCPSNFPSGPSFGAAFDRSLISRMATIVGQELRAMVKLGKGITPAASLDCWGPVINMNRDPRWGRNGEGGTEDAYAMGELAHSWTSGFQSPRKSLLNSSRTLLQGVLTLKHMSVNSVENTAPFRRQSFDANAKYGVNPFVLADYYLRPFKRAIQGADARGVMCSYNSVMGVPTCLSELMRDEREQWGFQGYVTSDSDSVNNAFNQHHYVRTGEEAVALALTKGQCDINSGDTYNKYLSKAIEQKVHNVSMTDVDRALFNTFKQRFDLGLFDPEASYEWPTADDVGTSESWALTLRASQEGIVLLRNDAQVLPLRKGTTVAVVGPHAKAQEVMMQPYPFRTFCASGKMDCIASPFDAIAAINGETNTQVAEGCDLFETSQAGFSAALALAKAADVVVLTLGIETCGMNPAHNLNPRSKHRCYQAGETDTYVFPDQYLELESHDRTTIQLPEVQQAFAAKVLALGKPTVIVLMNAGAVAMDTFLPKDHPAPLAIIEAFYPGPRGGEALAQGIFGLHNRWGRMPYTIYPANFTAEADMLEHDLRIAPGRTYRYNRNPTFSFGQGLSLTSWKVQVDGSTAPDCLRSLRTNLANEPCKVSLKVSNVGSLTGDIVIMAYFKNQKVATGIQRRQLDGKQLLTPLKQLFDFTRLVDVGAGASAVVTFDITAADLAEVNASSGDLISEAGDFLLSFEDGGANSLNLAAEVLGTPIVLEAFPHITPPAPSPPGPPPAARDTIQRDGKLEAGDSLTSASGTAVLEMQKNDGNLVLYSNSPTRGTKTAVWSTGLTHDHPGAHLTLQGSDGNLVLRGSDHTALWSTGTNKGAVKAVLGDDCNLVVLDSNSKTLWSTKTNCVSIVV